MANLTEFRAAVRKAAEAIQQQGGNISVATVMAALPAAFQPSRAHAESTASVIVNELGKWRKAKRLKADKP